MSTPSRSSDATRSRYASARTRSDASTSTTDFGFHTSSNASATASLSSRTPNAASASSSSRSLLTRPSGTVPSAPINAATAARRNRRDASSVASSLSGAGVGNSTPSPFAITAREYPASRERVAERADVGFEVGRRVGLDDLRQPEVHEPACGVGAGAAGEGLTPRCPRRRARRPRSRRRRRRFPTRRPCRPR